MRQFAADPHFNRRLPAILDACMARGACFEVVTEAFWLDPIRWSITSALRHAVRRAEPFERDLVQCHLENGALSIAELSVATGLGHAARHAALALCARGRATFRRDRPVSHETLIRLIKAS